MATLMKHLRLCNRLTKANCDPGQKKSMITRSLNLVIADSVYYYIIA